MNPRAMTSYALRLVFLIAAGGVALAILRTREVFEACFKLRSATR